MLNWPASGNNGNPAGQTVTHDGPDFSSPVVFSPSYQYDTLNRLESVAEGSQWSNTFGYDRYGNLWLAGSAGSGQPYQPLMPSSSSFSAATNRLLANANVFTYTYDGLGQRVTKTAAGVTTTYVRDVFGNVAAEYGTGAGSPCTTCYLSANQLGTTRLVTDAGAAWWAGTIICRSGWRCRGDIRGGAVCGDRQIR